MESKKINQLATNVAPLTSDLTVIGDPVTGQLKKITFLQVASLIGSGASLTFNDVTTNGNTTANSITIGGLTITGADGVLKATGGVVGTYAYGGANGVATLDSAGKVPISQLPSSIMEYKGTWNANTNTPTLADGTGDNGDVYRVSVGGTINLGSGSITFTVGDYVIYNGSTWEKSDTTDSVASVFGRTGVITAQDGDYTLDLLGDVVLTSPASGNYLTYNGTSWINQVFPSFLSSDKVVIPIRNNSGSTITRGTVVYINGAVGNKPTVAKALASSDLTSAQTLGLIQDDVINNADGYVVVIGECINIDTSAFTEGTQLYLSPTTAGTYTSTKQYAPNHLVYVGIVTRSHPTQGIIQVKTQNGFEVDEIHNISAQTPANNDGLFYESSTSLWKNKSISTVLGFTPISLGSLSAVSPLSYNNGTGAFSIQAATTSQNGYLSSTDWNTFNNKLTSPLTTLGDLLYFGASHSRLPGNITASKLFLSQTGTGTVSAAPVWSAVTKSDVGLSLVENTALSTWAGSTNITTLGTIGTGTWNATTIGTNKGGTGLTAIGTGLQLLRVNAGATALEYFTPTYITLTSLSATSPLSYNNTTGAFSIQVANTTQNGYLSNTDWNTFNGKQSAITLTTTGNSGAATFVTNTLNIPTYTLAGLGGQPLNSNLTSISGLSYVSSSFVKMTAANTFTLDTNTYLTANQTITLSGNVTGSGTTSIATTIAANVVTNAMLSQVATSTIKGRITAATGNVEDLTGTQVTTLLDVFTTTLKGLVPSSGGGTTNFLRADGTWAAPTGTGFTNPMTTLGDTMYQGASAVTRLPGNITTAKQYLSQTGTGTVSAAPSWASISGADVTGAALTEVDDTNVTCTLGGTPATALLRSVSLTFGWAGQLAVSRGGTGASTITGVLIGNGTSAVTGITGTASQLLRRNAGNTAYEFFTGGNLTKTDDTNVTLTLGGTPTASLLNAVSLTMGWTGQLSVARGGTGLSALGTANQLIRVNATATALEYFSPTYITAAITSLNGLTAATQTFTNDTNVTIVSTTSAHAITWAGQLAVSRGGTGLSALGTSLQLIRVNSGGTALEYFTPTYLTANQTITLSGDVTGSGTTAITTTIANNVVTFAKMQTIATASFLGRTTAATGNVENLTGTQATALLDVFSSTLKGLVPASGGGTTNFLRADGTWAAPTGGGTLTGSGSANTIAKWNGSTSLTNSLITDDGTWTTIAGFRFSTSANLPAGTGGSAFFTGNYASPISGRIFIGDGTGYSFGISKRSASVTTDLFAFLDNGNFGIGVNPTSKLHVSGNGTFENGILTAGNVTSTNGSIILQGSYSSGTLTSFGTSFSSGSPVIGFGVTPSTSAQYSFLSATTLTSFPRGAVVVDDSFKFFTGAAQTVTVGSAVTVTKAFEIATNGQLKLPYYTATSSFSGTAVGYLGFDSAGNIITTTGTGGASGNMSAISIRRTTTYNLTATLTAVTFDTNDLLNNNTVLNHSTSTNTERITIGETGLYMISYNFSFSDASNTANNNIQCGVYQNNVTLIGGSTSTGQNSSSDEEGISRICYALLTSGDYITFKAAHNGTINGTIRIGASFTATLMKGQKGDPGSSGSFGYTYSTVTTSYTETATSGYKVILVDTTAGAVTITLPSAVSNTSQLVIKKIAGSNSVILDGNASETIDGSLTATISVTNTSLSIISNNSNWFII